MSRLEELIAELCPDGVEFKYLGDFANIKPELFMMIRFLNHTINIKQLIFRIS